MIAPSRLAAYGVLRAVNGGRADLPSALARERGRLTDERDRALAGEIATGTLRWQAAFDRIVEAFTGRPPTRLDPEVLDVLRLTIFQLLHLDRVPASAAVNDAVDLTRKIGKKSAGALVNAVLRRVSRERGRLPLPARPGAGADRASQVAYLATSLSHPAWLVARWLDRHGFEAAERWCEFNNTPAALTLRANTLRTTAAELARGLLAHGVETTPGAFAAEALVVTRGNPLATPLHGRGLFVVQDEASQLVAAFASAARGESILDACASPGGKTTAMAAAMEDDGLIVAMDVRPRRVRLLADAVKASGASIVRVVHADAARPLPLAGRFDCVLVDAPCSGLGTLRRDPDIRWRRHEADLESLAALELRILANAAEAVRPGGRLVYATCSSEPEENEQVVARFLQADRRFVAAAPRNLSGPMRPLVDEAGHLRTLPFRDGLEAFFAATVEKPVDLG